MSPTDTTNPSSSSEQFEEMRERFEKLSGEWKEQATQFAEQAKTWIIRYPGTSLAVAAGAGLLLGMLAKRK